MDVPTLKQMLLSQLSQFLLQMGRFVEFRAEIAMGLDEEEVVEFEHEEALLDLLDAQNELFQAQLAATDGDYRVILANYELLFTMGQLLTNLQIPVAALNERSSLR